MKADNQTMEINGMPPLPKKRGRPAKPDAKTNAERQAEFRAKKKADGICPCCGQAIVR